jgi:hypothetical protein
VICPTVSVHPNAIAAFSKEKAAIGSWLSVTGYYVNDGRFRTHGGTFVDVISFSEERYTYTNAIRLAVPESDPTAFRTGFSGSAITDTNGVVGILDVCFHATPDGQNMWLCGGPSGEEIQGFLKANGIKFYTN